MSELTDYPFYRYIAEDKSQYKHARDCGWIDEDDDFLIGESGGFLLNISLDWKFVNTHLFTKAADAYRINGKYTSYLEDTIPHRQFRLQEEAYRMYGMSQPCKQYSDGRIENIHITGEHYNFINYCPIVQLDEDSISISNGKLKADKKTDFAKLIDAQYWYYKIKEFARQNGFHLIIDKTRRGGFSYIEGTGSAHIINMNPGRTVIHAASDSKFLIKTGGLSDFMKRQIIFYESKTPFKRDIAVQLKDDLVLGFKNPDGTTSIDSWNSACFSVSAMNNPDCAIGKDARDIKCEEMSMFDNFDEFMNVTEPTLRTGAFTTGMLTAWGTAGSASSAWQVLEQNFYNPKGFNFMPFENVWDKESRDQLCGYFKPYCWGLQGILDGVPSLDKDGNSNILLGYQIALNERAEAKETSKTFSEFISYCGQYANMPSESFSSVSDNAFSSTELDDWEQRLKNDDDYKFYQDGKFEETDDITVKFVTNAKSSVTGGRFNVDYFDYIKFVPRRSNEHAHGCCRRFFPPQLVEYYNGERMVKEIPRGLYSISYDPVAIDKKNKEITLKHSHNSIKVWMNPHICNGFKGKLVMSYYGRPETLEESDRICYNMARYYNCIGTTCVEVNRGETVANFKKWKALKYLKRDPLFIWNTDAKNKEEGGYGFVLGDGVKKLDAIRFLVEYLYEEVAKDRDGNPILNLHSIYDYQSILELKKWNNVGNFDRVSEMLIRAIEWKSLNIKPDARTGNRRTVTKNDIMDRDWF